MPIVAPYDGSVVGPGPGPGPGPGTGPDPTPTPVPNLERLKFTLTRGPNRTLPLTGAYQVQVGVDGLDTGPTSLLERRSAGVFGSFAAGFDSDARDVFLPLLLRGMSVTHLKALRKALLTDMCRTGELVRLVVESPNGSLRWIEGYRVGDGGPWGEGTFSVSGVQKIGLTLRCPDPWWRSDPVVWPFNYAGGGGFFPLLPVALSPSRVSGEVSTLDMVGDVESYPTWTLTGPLTAVTATDMVRGRSWTVTGPLLAGQSAIVRTDPRLAAEGPMVTGPDGSSWGSHLAAPFDLWPLGPEAPRIKVELATASTGASVTAVVNPLWESAL